MNRYMRTGIATVEKSDIITALKHCDDGVETVDIPVSYDLYAVFNAFDIDPMLVNPVKKCCGNGERGHKDFLTDLREARDAMSRAIAIYEARERYGV